MRSPGINGEGELRGNRLTQVHLEKMAIKTVCVCVCVCVVSALLLSKNVIQFIEIIS